MKIKDFELRGAITRVFLASTHFSDEICVDVWTGEECISGLKAGSDINITIPPDSIVILSDKKMTSSTQTSASNKPVVADEYSARPVFWNSERLYLLMLVFYATLFVVVLILPLGILISRSFTDRN